MKKQATLLMMRGLPLSGKSEWATRWVQHGRNRVRVSWTDMLRLMGRDSRDARLLAFESAVHTTVMALRSGFDVVVDEMNVNPMTFNIFVARAQQEGASVEWHNMGRSAAECKRRNAQMGHPVADMEIDRLAQEFANILKE